MQALENESVEGYCKVGQGKWVDTYSHSTVS
jgi:hypothetical protein